MAQSSFTIPTTDRTQATPTLYNNLVNDLTELYARNGGWSEESVSGLSAFSPGAQSNDRYISMFTGGNLNTRFQKGDKVRVKQTGGSYKYFYVEEVTSTLLSLNAGVFTDTAGNFTLIVNPATAITELAVSRAVRPFGFPQRFNFAPTLTNITVGNGTQTASFALDGGLCDFVYRLVLGGTSAISGAPVISAPVAIQSSGFPDFVGSGVCYDVSETRITPAYALSQDGTGANYLFRYIVESGAETRMAQLASNLPFTWATGDILQFRTRHGW